MKPRARPPRAVIVTRPTDYELLIRRHATRGQAAFFLESRGQKLADLDERHGRFQAAYNLVSQAVPREWRRSHVPREDLNRFLFEPDDIVLALGQDGLVANVAKYLRGQPVIGINPDPARYDGVLAAHPPTSVASVLSATVAHDVQFESRTMVEARLDDGQRLLALNEIFVGHRTHQSARYRLRFHDVEERHSSSGLIVTTGTGATGWARSISRQRPKPPSLPKPCDPSLTFFVREPFPSVATATSIEQGCLSTNDPLTITSEMNEDGVVFGDGIEDDRVVFPWGSRAVVQVSEVTLQLVR